MGSIIDMYTVVEDHTEVGGRGCSMRRRGSRVRLARGKKELQPLTYPSTATTPIPEPTDATSVRTPETVCGDAPPTAMKDFGASGGCVCDESKPYRVEVECCYLRRKRDWQECALQISRGQRERVWQVDGQMAGDNVTTWTIQFHS